jgi:hypothetical protein
MIQIKLYIDLANQRLKPLGHLTLKLHAPGFEPGTLELKARCSTRLSYAKIILRGIEPLFLQ